MRRIVVTVCLALCAAPAWAGLDHVKAIAFDEKPVVALARVTGVDLAVPEMTGTLARITVLDNAVPQVAALPAAVRLPGDLPCVWALPGSRASGSGELPRFPGLGLASPQEVDPFLTWFDIWSEGALGQLRQAALEAAKSGDDAAYQRLAAEYWAGVASATERRRVLGGMPGDDASGLRGARRSGR